MKQGQYISNKFNKTDTPLSELNAGQKRRQQPDLRQKDLGLWACRGEGWGNRGQADLSASADRWWETSSPRPQGLTPAEKENVWDLLPLVEMIHYSLVSKVSKASKKQPKSVRVTAYFFLTSKICLSASKSSFFNVSSQINSLPRCRTPRALELYSWPPSSYQTERPCLGKPGHWRWSRTEVAGLSPWPSGTLQPHQPSGNRHNVSGPVLQWPSIDTRL